MQSILLGWGQEQRNTLKIPGSRPLLRELFFAILRGLRTKDSGKERHVQESSTTNKNSCKTTIFKGI